MLVVYATDSALERRAWAALQGLAPVCTAAAWSELPELHRTAQCSVVVAPSLRLEDLLPRLSPLRAIAPSIPVVVVTSRVCDEWRTSRALGGDAVAGTHAFERRLRLAVQRSCVRATLARLGSQISSAPAIPEALRRALTLACADPHACHSIASLAGAVGRDRSTLWHQWQRTSHLDLRLEDFLGWLLILRAAGLRAAGVSWAFVADDLGVHQHTLSRLAQRLAGVTLRQLAAEGPSATADRFRRNVLVQMLGDDSTFWADMQQSAVAAPLGRRHSDAPSLLLRSPGIERSP